MAQRGRALLICMVALAVLAEAALALGSPMWRRYSIEQHIEDALGQAGATKLAVMEAATVMGGFEQLRASDLRYNAKAASGKYVSRVEVTDGGLITVVTHDTGESPDPVFLLAPKEVGGASHGDIVWDCQLFLGDATLVPTSCERHLLATSDQSASADPPATSPAF